MLNRGLISPIVLAAVVSIITFAALWRAGRESDRAGSPTWTFLLVVVAYAGSAGAFLYFSGGRPVSGGFDVFMIAVGANALGAGIVYALMNAFVYTRGQPMLDRIPTMIGALILLAGMIFGTVQLGHG